MKQIELNDILSKEFLQDVKALKKEVDFNKDVLGCNISFSIGQIVYLKTDNEQNPRMVVGINIRPNNQVIYILNHGTDDSGHYDIEISEERDIIKATSC
jgi:hypothetical protein